MKKSLYLGLFLVLLTPFTSHAALDANLKYGSSGSSVMELQEFLTSQHVYSGPITGNFFSLTLQGVKDFQTKQSIDPISGYWGPLSRAKAQTLLNLSISDEDEKSETGIIAAGSTTDNATQVTNNTQQNVQDNTQTTTVTVTPVDDLSINTILQPASISKTNGTYEFSYEIKDSVNTVVGTPISFLLDGSVISSKIITNQNINSGIGNNKNYFSEYFYINTPQNIGQHSVMINAGSKSLSFSFNVNQ